MKKVLIPLFLCSGWIWLLCSDIPAGENFIPSMGRFLNPFEGIWQSAGYTPLPSAISSEHPGEEILIKFDDRDVPHIYASSVEDAVYAQGYLHAANRLFSMDISTRAAAGRLSELIGQRTLSLDHQRRERGFERSAIEKAKSWESNEVNKRIIDAYVRGVNDYITSLDYSSWPVEYKILSHGPVVWSSLHTALMATNMAIMLCLAENDLEYTHARNLLSAEEFAYLYPEHNPLESPVIPYEKKWDFTALQAGPANVFDENGKLIPVRQETENAEQDIHGSNNWAISPRKTANGYALLANDPHLSLTLPNIWYEMEIHTPEMSVHGVSIPGLPFIVIGFNESIAWGTTNSGQDVLDWYRITWKDSSRQEYLLDGKYVKADLGVETIKVRGRKSIVDTVRYTQWGPVISEGDHKDLAMKWIGHARARANDLAYLQKINVSKNSNDYREAVEAFQYPAQNKVFASVDGDVAISVAGTMPLREPGTGKFILDGSLSTSSWTGFIPFDHAPFIINPTRGYVSSANQAPAGTDYPYPLLGERTFEDYRGRVINHILDSAEKITIEDVKALQQNNFNLHAAEVLPLMLSGLTGADCFPEDMYTIVDQLSGWNYEQHRDSLSPILFDLWYAAFEKMSFDELDSMNLLYPEDWRTIELVRDATAHQYFDLISTENVIETVSDILCSSFTSMVKAYNALEPGKQKHWGKYKASEIPHLARFAPFGIEFVNTSGGRHIVNAMSKSHGPSWRMIVELSSPPKALVNYPGGQSGNPASPHYADMLEGYFDGKYYEVALQKDPSAWTSDYELKITTR